MNQKCIANAWIPYRRPSFRPHLRLFCFPYAGGSASAFHAWFNFFPPGIDICAIQYPGREGRITEAPFTSLTPLVNTLARILIPELNIPFAFFGHSLGALISFELARQLQKIGFSPVILFISGYRAPTITNNKPPMHLLPNDEFVQKLRVYNGTPDAVLQNEDIMNLLLPILRADFQLHETYVYLPGELLNCPITVCGGMEDPAVSYHDLKPWQAQTADSFKISMFPGDHFYIHNNIEGLVNLIYKELITTVSDNQEKKRLSHS